MTFVDPDADVDDKADNKKQKTKDDDDNNADPDENNYDDDDDDDDDADADNDDKDEVGNNGEKKVDLDVSKVNLRTKAKSMRQELAFLLNQELERVSISVFRIFFS